ncbi:S49 family peptidase [Rhizobium leguminosarum]|uniref:S49 family peptidase n=1 Tax=Rhizobium leguminosarum TaxID=384 RepID=UPI001C91FB0C|nr:S49 family peptidase [Rhizobium leguminosarum]MBY2911364.1 S49 family peptidase [Rhizobium leguminosarum]
MTFHHAHIAQRVFDTPLLYDARKAEAFAIGLGGRIAGGTVAIANPAGAVDHVAFSNGRPSAGRLGDRMGRILTNRNQRPYDLVDGVAVIGIEGTLIHKGAFIGQSDSGDTSYQGLQTQIAMARNDMGVKGVVFEVDSYGGEVSGAFETATMIRALSKEKPTVAILTDFAFSAGYLLASQARQIILPEFGGAGSIGVIMMHANFAAFYEKDGVAITIIRSGKHKAEGNPFEDLPERVVDRWQSTADAMRDKFAETVALGRGRRLSKAQALATEADPFDAADSVKLGLADAVGDPSTAFDAFIKEVNRS